MSCEEIPGRLEIEYSLAYPQETPYAPKQWPALGPVNNSLILFLKDSLNADVWFGTRGTKTKSNYRSSHHFYSNIIRRTSLVPSGALQEGIPIRVQGYLAHKHPLPP